MSKIIYAAQLLGIAAIASGKLSAALLSQRAVLLKSQYFQTFVAAVVAWTIFSLLATAFQCQLPNPWIFMPSNCPSKGYLQYPVTILNMVTDVILSVWVIGPVWRVNMAKLDRIIVVILFGTRIMCVQISHQALKVMLIKTRIPGVAVGQLISLEAVIKSSDQTCG